MTFNYRHLNTEQRSLASVCLQLLDTRKQFTKMNVTIIHLPQRLLSFFAEGLLWEKGQGGGLGAKALSATSLWTGGVQIPGPT